MATTEGNTYRAVASWVVFLAIMILANKTRLGHVAIYYGLLLLILLLLVVEYKQIAPLLNPPTIAQFGG